MFYNEVCENEIEKMKDEFAQCKSNEQILRFMKIYGIETFDELKELL